MKRIVSILLFVALVGLSFIYTGCGSSTLTKTEYTIATGSKSGVYYPIGESLSAILKLTYPNVKLNVIETQGSVQNLSMLKENKVDFALCQNDIAFYAAEGEKMFENNKITNISGIGTLFPEVVQIIVRKDSGISKLSEFEGKKIAVGSKDSGTFYNAQQILTSAGVWEKIDHQYLSASDAMRELEAGNIQGFFYTSGIPNPSIVELSKRVEIAIIPIDPDQVQKLVTTHSFYFPSTIPAGQYTGQDTDISAVEINAILLSSEKLTENDQYLITKALFGKPNDLGKSNPRLSKLTKNSLRRQMPVNLGKGAYKAHTEM